MKRYWYKFRVKYGKELGTGNKKKVSEEYLVDAESFTETEKRANPYLLWIFRMTASMSAAA